MPSKAWKNAMASSITSAPTTLATVRRNVCAATLTAFTIPRPGEVTMRKSRWSRNCDSRRGASMKSRALRVGGVSTTTRSKSVLWWSS